MSDYSKLEYVLDKAANLLAEVPEHRLCTLLSCDSCPYHNENSDVCRHFVTPNKWKEYLLKK